MIREMSITNGGMFLTSPLSNSAVAVALDVAIAYDVPKRSTLIGLSPDRFV
jgi:hypothetical protein